jgi:hypothetical protein
MSCTRGCCATQAEHFRSVRPAIKALVDGNRADQKLARDMKSYKAMIDQGLEPKCMTGAYDLERTATSAAEIEGRLPDDLGV